MTAFSAPKLGNATVNEVTLSGNPVAPVTECYLLHNYPTPVLEARWWEFLERMPFPSAYDSPEYFREPHWTSKQPFAVLAIENGKVIGSVTGVHKGKKVVCGLPSRPQVCVDQASADAALQQLLSGLLEESDSSELIQIFSWRSTALAGFEHSGFMRKELEGDVVLDLSKGADALYKQFHTNRKRNVQTALRNKVEVSEATDADFDAYWKVHKGWQQTTRKKIVTAASLGSAKKVQELQFTHRRFLARYQGKVIAATNVRFCPGGLVEYAGNCSLDEYNRLRPNDLLIWRTIQWACQEGFKKYSLGASHPFLTKCGGKVEGIDRYQLDRTFGHRYEAMERLRISMRTVLRKCPRSLQNFITRALCRQ
jgi:Acetyltransferase (GNAT) domain